MNLPVVLAVSDWGLAFGSILVLLLFLVIGYVVVQGTRVQLAWRQRVDEGDVDAIQTLVGDEVARWKAARMPKGMEPSVWHGVQGAELLEVTPDSFRLSASAEGQYALASGERRQVSSALREGMKLTAQLADMAFYDIPNVMLPYVQIDIYSTFRDEHGSSQQCILSTLAERSVAAELEWDSMDAEEVVRAFGGRYALDDRGNPLPIQPDKPRTNGIPSAFYEPGDSKVED
ncbi:MAG: hypothetical protein WD359_00415 [Dehalococcoidia bacterium]